MDYSLLQGEVLEKSDHQTGTYKLTPILAARIWFADRLLSGPITSAAVQAVLNPFSTVSVFLRLLGVKAGSGNVLPMPTVRAGMNLITFGDSIVMGKFAGVVLLLEMCASC